MWNPLAGRVSRRTFLQVGAIGVGGAALAAEGQASAPAASGKSIIMVYFPGGPSHIDMFDMKPQAPIEIRGEFSPIHSNVSGLEVCELLPKLSQVADKYTVIRGFQTPGGHDATDLTTGYPKASQRRGWRAGRRCP